MNTFTYNSKTYTVSNGTLFEVVRSRRFKGLMAVTMITDATLAIRAWMNGMTPSAWRFGSVESTRLFNSFFTPSRNN